MSGQALLDIVTESLVAFPEDAHIKVFQFLSAAGASDKEKKKVQAAWTRVSMATEAFGKRNRAVDPVQFGKDFIKELSADVRELGKLEEMHHRYCQYLRLHGCLYVYPVYPISVRVSIANFLSSSSASQPSASPVKLMKKPSRKTAAARASTLYTTSRRATAFSPRCNP